jgi:hypothetical protein
LRRAGRIPTGHLNGMTDRMAGWRGGRISSSVRSAVLCRMPIWAIEVHQAH